MPILPWTPRVTSRISTAMASHNSFSDTYSEPPINPPLPREAGGLFGVNMYHDAYIILLASTQLLMMVSMRMIKSR